MLKKAYVEITNACNRNCAFCPGTGRERRFMAVDEFRRVLSELKGCVRCLYFHVMGEPLLHPAIGTFLDMAGDAGLPVNLTTNGTLLGTRGGELLGKPALRQVSVSLHSLGDGEEGRRCLEGILAFAHATRRDGGALVSLRLWNGAAGQENTASGWIIDRLKREYSLSSEHFGRKTDNRGLRLADGIYLNLADQFQWPSMRLPEIGQTGFCMGLRDQVGVLCDGTVVPCCLDGEGAMALGNLFRQTLSEILASERARAIHEGFSRRMAVEDLCRRCGYRGRFG